LSELRDALGSCDREILEMHLDAGCDRMYSEMHLEAKVHRTQRCTWRLRFSDVGNTLGGYARASLEMHLEVMIN